MQVPWTLSKYGSIDLPEAGQAQANMIMTQDRFDPSGEVNVEVLTNVQYFWMPYWQNHPVPSSIELRCDGRKNETVVLSDPSRIKSAGRNATFSFKQWTHSSTEDVMESGTKIKCSVELTSPGCVRDGRNTNYRADGVVERSGEGCPDIAWLAEGISWQLGIKYASETSAPVPVGGCLMVPVTTITSEWILATAATLRQLLQLIEKALQQPLLAFSMMSKSRIEWYRIEVWVIKGPKDSREFETAIRRVTKPSSQSHYPPMEDQETLANGRFQAFLDAIKSHPQQPTVSRVMDFPD